MMEWGFPKKVLEIGRIFGAFFSWKIRRYKMVINDHRIYKILEKEEVVLYNICMDNFARRKS